LVENVSVDTDEDMDRLKSSMRLMFPRFCSEILKILLYREEVHLACLLTAYYELHIYEEIFELAIDKCHF